MTLPCLTDERDGRKVTAMAGLSPPSAVEPQERLAPAGFHPYRVLSLFAGIGGFDLGLERTGGFKTVAFCEIDPFCQRVLRKHWPEVRIYNDIQELSATKLAADGIAPNVLAGGFPCQDISDAGNKLGIEGERSALWSEYARLIGELRPLYVIVENVAALLYRGMGVVLGDLAALGFDAEWHCIPASAVGAPHRRDRVWIVAYPARQRPAKARQDSKRSTERAGSGGEILAHTTSGEARCQEPPYGSGEAGEGWQAVLSSLGGCGGLVGDYNWGAEPDICRVVDGVSANVDRVAALGNAVVPDIPELIGRAILAQAGEARRAETALAGSVHEHAVATNGSDAP